MRSIWCPIVTGAVTLLSLATTSNTIQVTGATSGFDATFRARPIRQEINVLASSGDASWDLYVLALQRFQDVSADDPLSYFQIAGIHGYPKRPWDGVSGTGKEVGFCMHTSVLFPLWHRPYLALYEQMLSYHAQTIAEQYPLLLGDQYRTAASKLRIPYFDWAITPGLPDVLTLPILSVNTPDGIRNISNPLLQYTFPMDMLASGYFSSMWNAPNIPQQPNTVRQYDSVTGQSNEIAAWGPLIAGSAVRLSEVYTLLSDTANYTAFSLYHGNRPGPDIEGIHNDVHIGIGGLMSNGSQQTAKGHMTVTSLSAFDPVFWLHHANVDRLVALWQAIHPNEYVQPTVNKVGTYYLANGSIDTADTPLAPFHDDDATSMWTAAKARDITVFGYTYPELVNTNISASELQKVVTQKVNELYAPGGHSNGTFRARSRRSANIAQAMSHVHADTAPQLGVNNMDIQWHLRISIEAGTDQNSLSVFLFIGQPPADVNHWPAASNLIGLHTPYLTGGSFETSDAAQQIDIPCSHTIAAAVSRGVLSSTSSDDVVPFLEQNLVAKVIDQAGAGLDAASVPGIKVSILSRNVEPRKTLSDFPMYGAFVEHASIDS